MVRSFKTCIIQYFYLGEIKSYPEAPSGKQKRLRRSLLKACNGVLASIREKYLVIVSPVRCAEKKEASQMIALFTVQRLREMVEKIPLFF